MLDRKAIHASEQVDRSVAAGASIPDEGVILCQTIEAGQAVVSVKGTVDGTELLAGVAILPYMLPATMTLEQQFVVPASGSLIFQMRFGNIVSLSELASVVGGSALTVDETFAGTPSTGTVKVNILTGQIKFAAGNAGAVVNFLCRVSLTVAQARMIFQERALNNRGLVGQFNQVGVMKGYVEYSTDQFDTTKDYSTVSSTNVLKLGNNGLITIGGSGPALPQAKVLATPDLSGSLQGPMLRISMLIG